MVRRPLPRLVSFALTFANLWSAYRRKINPRTGTEYSEDFSLEFARSSSAAPHRRFSSSVVFAGISMQWPFLSFFRYSPDSATRTTLNKARFGIRRQKSAFVHAKITD